MTRDEAIGIIHGVTYPETANETNGEACSGDFARDRKLSIRIVDGLAALGVLKLDEPKSVHQKFDEALRGIVASGWRHRYWNMIHEAGLKIVEK